ncbi:MAG: prenyltransferase/squalene oxidase repeat-containing protein [Candidatus Thorarchaeota archaeon]|jgi:prenyltransferase beta subunit
MLSDIMFRRDVRMRSVKIAAITIAIALVVLTLVAQPVSANPTTRRQSLRAYIDENYDITEGGYALVSDEISSAAPTFGALSIFDDWDLLGVRPPVIDFLKLKNFTQKLHWTLVAESVDRYGGFGEYIAGPVNQKNAFDGINIFDMLSQDVLGDIPNIDRVEFNGTAALYWINQTQTESGGFSDEVGNSPDLVSTFYALNSMEIAIQTSDEDTWEEWLYNSTATAEWILSCREGDGFKLSPDSNIVGVTATAAAVLALTILGETIPNHQGIINWILSRQVISSQYNVFLGGFEESLLTNDTNLASTYWALQALDLLGGLASVDADLVSRFIVDCQAADSSFALIPGADTGSLYYASYAVKALSYLGTEYENLMDEEDPNNPPPPLIDWRWGLIAGIIVIAAVGGLYSTRMD